MCDQPISRILKESEPFEVVEKRRMQHQNDPPLVNLSSFREEFFKEAIQYHVYEYWTHFKNRLAAIYVGGSVHRNEAVPGVSDLDLYPFILDSFNERDGSWFNQAGQRVESRHAGTNGLCPPRSVSEVLEGLKTTADETTPERSRTWVYRLRYDTTLVFGRDLIAGYSVPDMDKQWARDYFQDVWDFVRYAAGLEAENRTDFPLPKTPSRYLRKLARSAILGGAYLLIGQGKLYSFKGAEILPLLKANFPHWNTFLDATETLYIFPNSSATESEISAYLAQLVLWTDWVGVQLSEPEGRNGAEV